MFVLAISGLFAGFKDKKYLYQWLEEIERNIIQSLRKLRTEDKIKKKKTI